LLCHSSFFLSLKFFDLENSKKKIIFFQFFPHLKIIVFLFQWESFFKTSIIKIEFSKSHYYLINFNFKSYFYVKQKIKIYLKKKNLFLFFSDLVTISFEENHMGGVLVRRGLHFSMKFNSHR